jgi:hypothetical protein
MHNPGALRPSVHGSYGSDVLVGHRTILQWDLAVITCQKCKFTVQVETELVYLYWLFTLLFIYVHAIIQRGASSKYSEALEEAIRREHLADKVQITWEWSFQCISVIDHL